MRQRQVGQLRGTVLGAGQDELVKGGAVDSSRRSLFGIDGWRRGMKGNENQAEEEGK